MNNAGKLLVLGALAFLGAGLALTGCKSAPPLTQDQAKALIQAKYDQTPAAGADIVIDQQGLEQGVTDGYWVRTKLYPNQFYADFKLTPDGVKALTLPKGGDTFEWRPEGPTDNSYTLIVTTATANHLIARDLKDVQDEELPGASAAKGVDFSEAVNLTGVPAPLVDIAHNPGNQLAVARHADFALVNGAWTLHSID